MPGGGGSDRRGARPGNSKGAGKERAERLRRSPAWEKRERSAEAALPGLVGCSPLCHRSAGTSQRVVASRDEHPRESSDSGFVRDLAPDPRSHSHFSKLPLSCSCVGSFGPGSSGFQSLLSDRGNPFCMETLLGRKSSVSRVSSRWACHGQSG